MAGHKNPTGNYDSLVVSDKSTITGGILSAESVKLRREIVNPTANI